ncbi:MAG: hypothetical protein HF982_14325 [Desulfobacteraceae bacterium]|nr:hypothetical protein [Desulfobacteraceae bacterium]MBC2720734.1 hypothetical protein [Desulfobacteraceae bacterium]
MTRKFFLFLNLLLIAVFAYRLLALYAEIKYRNTKGQNSVDYSLVDIKRPPLKIREEYRNIFGLKLSEIAKENSKPDSGNRALNELVSGDEVVRVIGIFISKDIRYAVISLSHKKKKHKKEVKKVIVGDKIKDFSVISILPGSISLADAASNKIDLRIFVTVNG